MPLDDRSAMPSLRSWMSAVGDLARAVTAAQPLEELLPCVAEQACTLIGFDFSALMIADADGERLRVAGSHRLSASYVRHLNTDHPLRLGTPDPGVDAPAARAFREGLTSVVPDVHRLPDFYRLRRLADRQGYRALIAAPLRHGTTSIGVLVAYSASAREFSAAEVELTELLAEQAATAVGAARVRESERRAVDELSAAYERLRVHQQGLERAETQHRRLMELELDDVGLPHLVAWLASTLGHSVTVEDPAGRVLASAPHDGYVAPPGAPVTTRGSGYRLVELRPADSTAWSTPVVLGGRIVGQLWLTGVDVALGDAERRTVERFALIVAFELLKERHGAEVEARLSGDLVGDLLRDPSARIRPALLARARALGCDLAATHVVVVVGLDPPGEPEHVERLATAALSRRGADRRVLVGRRAGSLVALVPDEPDARSRIDHLLDGVREAVAPRTVSAVIGTPGCTPAEHAAAAEVAERALALLQETGAGRVLHVADLGVHAMLLAGGTTPGLAAFSRRLLGPLEEHDARHATALLPTVRAWLRHECSAAATARALVVHRNTVTYRLGRIEELLDRRLRSPDTLVALQLAITVRDVEETAG